MTSTFNHSLAIQRPLVQQSPAFEFHRTARARFSPPPPRRRPPQISYRPPVASRSSTSIRPPLRNEPQFVGPAPQLIARVPPAQLRQFENPRPRLHVPILVHPRSPLANPSVPHPSSEELSPRMCTNTASCGTNRNTLGLLNKIGVGNGFAPPRHIDHYSARFYFRGIPRPSRHPVVEPLAFNLAVSSDRSSSTHPVNALRYPRHGPCCRLPIAPFHRTTTFGLSSFGCGKGIPILFSPAPPTSSLDLSFNNPPTPGPPLPRA